MFQTIKNLIKAPFPVKYYVRVNNTYVCTSFSFKKADEHYTLEVEFNNMFKSDYTKNIYLIRVISGKEEYVKVRSYEYPENVLH